jgi:hypothetical protein
METGAANLKKLDKDELDEDFVVSRIMVGNCPNCGSSNTRDCDQFQLGKIYIDSARACIYVGRNRAPE